MDALCRIEKKEYEKYDAPEIINIDIYKRNNEIGYIYSCGGGHACC